MAITRKHKNTHEQKQSNACKRRQIKINENNPSPPVPSPKGKQQMSTPPSPRPPHPVPCIRKGLHHLALKSRAILRNLSFPARSTPPCTQRYRQTTPPYPFPLTLPRLARNLNKKTPTQPHLEVQGDVAEPQVLGGDKSGKEHVDAFPNAERHRHHAVR